MSNGIIKFKRGLKASLPEYAPLGEPLFCTDTGEVFIGNGIDNPLIQLRDRETLEYLKSVKKMLEDLATTGGTHAHHNMPILDLITEENIEEWGNHFSGNYEDLKNKPTLITKEYVDSKYNDLFQSVSDGKTLVASAITDKGVDTQPTATFQEMAENILAIQGSGGGGGGSTPIPPNSLKVRGTGGEFIENTVQAPITRLKLFSTKGVIGVKSNDGEHYTVTLRVENMEDKNDPSYMCQDLVINLPKQLATGMSRYNEFSYNTSKEAYEFYERVTPSAHVERVLGVAKGKGTNIINFSVADYGDFIYLLYINDGNISRDAPASPIIKINKTTYEVNELPSNLDFKAYDNQSVVYGDYVYTLVTDTYPVGSINNITTPYIMKFNPKTDSFDPTRNYITSDAERDMAIALDGNLLYCYAPKKKKFFVIDLNTYQSTPLQAPTDVTPDMRNACIYNNKFYLQDTGNSSARGKVVCYDLSTKSWSTLSTGYNKATYHYTDRPRGVFVANKLAILGVSTSSSYRYGSRGLVFDLDTNSYGELEDNWCTNAMYMASSITNASTKYVVGDKSGDWALDVYHETVSIIEPPNITPITQEIDTLQSYEGRTKITCVEDPSLNISFDIYKQSQ